MIPEPLANLLGAAVSLTLARGTIVFGAALAVTAAARKLHSEIRHLVWLGVIASFLLVPLAWLKAVCIGMSWGGFVLAKISADGRTCENVFGQSAYPEELNHLGPSCAIAYRQ